MNPESSMNAEKLNIFGTYLRSLDAAPRMKRSRGGLLRLTRSGGGKIRYQDLWAKAYLCGYSADEFVHSLTDLVRRGKVQVARAAGAADQVVVVSPTSRPADSVKRPSMV
jgi:hypothetical protein